MPTSPTWLALACSALVAGGAVALAGCAADAGEATEAQEGELGEVPRSAGIAEGSLDEEGVLLEVNDRAVTADVLTSRAGLAASAASAIVAFRKADDGSPRWFASLDEVAAQPSVDKPAFEHLLADARAHGYVEASGFDPPTAARLSVPDHLPHPPTANDVTVVAGFDGLAPDAASAIVRSRLTNTVDPSNERFTNDTIRATHKAFTIALGNLFAQGSPHAVFVKNLGADQLTLIGTMSAVKPTILVAVKGGATTYYARGDSGGYEAIDTPKYPIIMRSKVQLDPQGVRLFYPAWSAKVLEKPTGTVIEGGHG